MKMNKQLKLLILFLLIMTTLFLYLNLSKKKIKYEKKVNFSKFLIGEKLNIEQEFKKLNFLYIIKAYDCPTCSEEYLIMNDFYNKYKKNINFIGFINFSGDKNKQRRIIEGTGIDFKINIDKNYNRWVRLGIKYFPAKLIVDKKGKIIF